MSTRRSLLLVGMVAVLLIGIGITTSLCVRTRQSRDLLLSDYPKLFEDNAMIVVGANASHIELESAQAIAANLKGLTGNEPMIKRDSKVSDTDKSGHNLVLVGTPYSNGVLQEVYNVTHAIIVTTEYPGAKRGILQILKNPWNEDWALLLVAGSDAWGVRSGSEMLVKGMATDGAIVVVGGISQEEAIEIARNDDRVRIYLKNYPGHRLREVSLLTSKSAGKLRLYWYIRWLLARALDPRTIPHETNLYVSVDAVTGEVLEVWVPE